jgi:hypothetical protein
MSLSKEIFPHAILDTHAISSQALLYTITILCWVTVDTHGDCQSSSQHKTYFFHSLNKEHSNKR